MKRVIIMNNYIICTTLCDKEDIAHKIIDKLLNDKLVSGIHLSKVYSKYWWSNKLEECDEYKIEFRTKLNLYDKIYNIIREIHDYEVFELSYRNIDGANKEFLEWIDTNCI